MTYYISKTVNQPFDAVVADITARLKEQGFGLLTDIDVQATLKSKIGAELGKYRILGACNPRFAHGNPVLKSAAEEVRRLLTKAVSQVGL